MKINDYILALTSGSLSASEEEISRLMNDFSKRFELKELAKPGVVSLGGRGEGQKEMNFIDWVKYVRAERVRNICFCWESNRKASLPSHIAAAFAGGQDYLLQLTTESSVKTYTLRTILCSQYELKASQFVELMDAQDQKDLLWSRAGEMVHEFNKLNDRPAIMITNIRDYFLGPEIDHVFDMLASQLLKEIQIECKIGDRSFYIPPQLSTLFFQSDFPFPEPSDKNYVYLYPVKEILGSDLLSLVNAQNFSEEVWAGCEIEFKKYPQLNLPGLASKELPEFIAKMNSSAVAEVSGIVCRVICTLCEQKKCKPFIPAALKNFFGPNEMEEKRAQARSRMGKEEWFIQSNKNPWELYFFERLEACLPLENSKPDEGAKNDFDKVLKEITTFAEKIQSPFAEAFLLAHYCFGAEIPRGNFDQKHLAGIKASMNKKKFSQRAIQNFENVFYYSEDMLKMNWDPERIYGLWAVSISDVFGGMGSWNDQYVESEQETYQRLSSELFSAMKNYFAVLLSFNLEKK
jgi:hypothetical protein